MSRHLSVSTAIFLLIFTTLTYNFILPIDGTLTNATEFDGYLEILKTTQTYKARLRIVEAIWGQILAERPNDLDTIAVLYKQLPTFPNSANVPIEFFQKKAAEELKQVIRRHLVLRNAELLSEALVGPDFYTSPQVVLYCDSLLDKYDYTLVKTAYERAIDDVFNEISTQMLAARLLGISRHNDERTFPLMIELQLHLFWHFTRYGGRNDVYIFNFASFNYKWQNMSNYQKLNTELRQRIDLAIAQLPSSVQNVDVITMLCKRLSNIMKPTSEPTQLNYKQVADELKYLIRRQLVHQSDEFLSEAFLGPEVFTFIQVTQYCDMPVYKYNDTLVKTAYEQAIEDVFNQIPTEKLAARLLGIGRQSDKRAFPLMIELQLHLFWHFTRNGGKNDVYIMNFAYYNYKWKNMIDYQKINSELRQRIDLAIDELPKSVRNFFFLERFMLRDSFYKEPFYTTYTMRLDDVTRATFTWISKEIEDTSFVWYKYITETLDMSSTNFDAQKHLTYLIRSEQSNIFLYFVPNCGAFHDIVGAWSTTGVPPPKNGDWTVHLIDGNLVFKQGDYAMCTSAKLYNNERRFVKGYKVLSDEMNDDKKCQWKVDPFVLTDFNGDSIYVSK